MFGLDREIYDPFESLYFLENLDSAYPTIDSQALMSATYLREIESGLDLALNQTVANGFESIAPLSKKAKSIKITLEISTMIRKTSMAIAAATATTATTTT